MLVQNPWAKWEDKADFEVPTATLQVYDYIAKELMNREGGTVLRASAATLCAKRRQLQRLGTEGTPLTPRKIVNFILGDLTEMVVKYYIGQACVGDGKLYRQVNFGDEINSIDIQGKEVKMYSQLEWTTKFKDLEVKGHPDGIGLRNLDNKWELIEVKSSANWGFSGFQKEGPGDYLKQSCTLMLSNEARELGIDTVRFWYLRKETGHLWDRLESFSKEIADRVEDEYLAAESDVPISAPHRLVNEMAGYGAKKKPTGRMIATFPCTYCPYLEKCHGSFRVDWKGDQWGNSKPIQVFERRS